MGAAHTGQSNIAEKELLEMKRIRDTLAAQGDEYKAQQVSIQIASGEAWMQLRSGNKQQALQRMREAADLEAKTEKHPVTPRKYCLQQNCWEIC